MFIQFLLLALSLSGISHAAIYGSGNLHEPFEESRPEIRRLARSTGALIFSDQLKRQNNGYRILGQSCGENFNLCESEIYGSQAAAAYCSAVLVSPDIVLTAGHCVDSQKICSNTFMVFDYAVKADHSRLETLPASQVYRCAKLLYTTAPHPRNNIDYALIRLERPVRDRAPVPFANDVVWPGRELFIIGHPLGLPTKIAKYGVVRGVGKGSLRMSISTFDHNSGSPIFDSDSGRLQAIYHSGYLDDLKRVGSCNQFAHYDLNYGPGEFGTKVGVIQKKLVKVMGVRTIR